MGTLFSLFLSTPETESIESNPPTEQIIFVSNGPIVLDPSLFAGLSFSLLLPCHVLDFLC